MTAAELLRGLDKAATAGPWKALLYEGCGSTFIEPNINTGNGYEGEIKERDARLIATARNLLPLLAGLVEACEGLSEPGTLGIYAACVRVNEALFALNAAAAKEVK